MQPEEKGAFKAGLWSLYQETAKLPPMINCKKFLRLSAILVD